MADASHKKRVAKDSSGDSADKKVGPRSTGGGRPQPKATVRPKARKHSDRYRETAKAYGMSLGEFLQRGGPAKMAHGDPTPFGRFSREKGGKGGGEREEPKTRTSSIAVGPSKAGSASGRAARRKVGPSKGFLPARGGGVKASKPEYGPKGPAWLDPLPVKEEAKKVEPQKSNPTKTTTVKKTTTVTKGPGPTVAQRNANALKPTGTKVTTKTPTRSTTAVVKTPAKQKSTWNKFWTESLFDRPKAQKAKTVKKKSKGSK